MNITRAQLAEIWLDYFNNYLTVAKWAEHHGLTLQEAELFLRSAKSCHENPHLEA